MSFIQWVVGYRISFHLTAHNLLTETVLASKCGQTTTDNTQSKETIKSRRSRLSMEPSMKELAGRSLGIKSGDSRALRRGRVPAPRWLWMLLLGVFLIAPRLAKVQLAGTGAVAGTVTDSTGAVVSNATVTATSVDTNERMIRSTTSAGDYNITPLTPGVYWLLQSSRNSPFV